MLRFQGYTKFSIKYFMIDVGSVLNMPWILNVPGF